MKAFLISGGCAVLIFAGVLCGLALGRRIGRHHLQRYGDESLSGLGALDAAVFGLMGLLIAFTFTGAATRFDDRRNLITQQVNAIGTAWLRLDLVGEPDRQIVQDRFREYVDAQLELGDNFGSVSALEKSQQRLDQLQKAIWSDLIHAVKSDRSLPLSQTVLPPVNEMFDLTTTRLLAIRRHPPLSIYILLFLLTVLSSLLAGFGMSKAKVQSPLHTYGFALILAVSIYLVLDMEHPRLGFIRIDSFDQAFSELRDTMK